MTNPSRTGRRLCRRTGLFAVSVTALMVLSGCTSAPSGADGAASLPLGPYSYAANPCPEPVLPGLSLPPLGDDFVCGTLTVPQDRARPGGGTVTVPVARQRARNPQPSQPPLLTLAGGSGGSGLLEGVTLYRGLGVNDNRDVIFVDTLWPNVAAGFDALSAACAAQPACHAMVPDLGMPST